MTSLSLDHQRKNKQIHTPKTNKQMKYKNKQTNLSSAQISPYANHWTNLKRAENQKEERSQPRSLGKRDLKHNKLKKQ